MIGRQEDAKAASGPLGGQDGMNMMPDVDGTVAARGVVLTPAGSLLRTGADGPSRLARSES